VEIKLQVFVVAPLRVELGFGGRSAMEALRFSP